MAVTPQPDDVRHEGRDTPPSKDAPRRDSEELMSSLPKLSRECELESEILRLLPKPYLSEISAVFANLENSAVGSLHLRLPIRPGQTPPISDADARWVVPLLHYVIPRICQHQIPQYGNDRGLASAISDLGALGEMGRGSVELLSELYLSKDPRFGGSYKSNLGRALASILGSDSLPILKKAFADPELNSIDTAMAVSSAMRFGAAVEANSDELRDVVKLCLATINMMPRSHQKLSLLHGLSCSDVLRGGAGDLVQEALIEQIAGCENPIRHKYFAALVNLAETLPVAMGCGVLRGVVEHPKTDNSFRIASYWSLSEMVAGQSILERTKEIVWNFGFYKRRLGDTLRMALGRGVGS